ncbi:Hypothetical predicted protein [Pelobates cultripes]|uniref:Uncharacterized protein n=1 Tax=Pelobates cultripes TaxID=61616 RepID=A0AAD1R408_PELCU|nr:Hypothetical predicted protein [Pelobates cultripes]
MGTLHWHPPWARSLGTLHGHPPWAPFLGTLPRALCAPTLLLGPGTGSAARARGLNRAARLDHVARDLRSFRSFCRPCCPGGDI